MSKQSSVQRNLAKRIAGITMPISRKRTRWERNWPCLCGSGVKYKNCCLKDISDLNKIDGNANVAVLSEDVQKLVDAHREAVEAEQAKKDGGDETNG